ncbi:MAG: hypothetical protein MUE32_08160 [Bacteroidales bacterium]|nr:hypothetical protein [Bacteroidales bacterium]
MTDRGSHLLHVALDVSELYMDTVELRMPRWMPGYYQIMEYTKEVSNFSAAGSNGNAIPVIKTNNNAWLIVPGNNTSFRISYDVCADKKFVANNFLDSTHAYIVPAATFMYVSNRTDIPVSVKVIPFKSWNDIATGLEVADGNENEYHAPDFDILYDCPILIGNLDELPSFTVGGIKHRFIAYNPGNFDRGAFITSLEKTVKAATEIMGDIPYNEYTFIGIGPGAGGIEHLNNTTVSFNGGRLDNPDAMKGMLKFLAHEYFHHYNVKRIRPYELGPFDYSEEARTNLLWMSEGLTVYYEYLIVRRAGLISEDELIASLESDINTLENDPGRRYQSLTQASYNTWSDGPFGNRSPGPDRSISYYVKGPLVGLVLDLKIRNATENKKSLDDVMRLLYTTYYRKLQRGFTDAEFQKACEEIAGISLSSEFEYVYTTREIDYSTYLSYAGLNISEEADKSTGKSIFTITAKDNIESLQSSIFRSWSGN